MSINDRIALILEDKNLTANEFAIRLKVQSSNISHIITGRNKPSFTFLEKLALEFPEISTDWLIRGEGSMYIADNKAEMRIMEEGAENFNSVEEEQRYPSLLFDIFEEKNEISSPRPRAEAVISHEEKHFNKEIESKTVDPEEVNSVNASPARIKSIIVYFNNGSFQEFSPK